MINRVGLGDPKMGKKVWKELIYKQLDGSLGETDNIKMGLEPQGGITK